MNHPHVYSCCKEVKALEAERDQLRNELVSCDKYAKEQYAAYEERLAAQAKEIERLKSHIAGLFIKDDPWKAKAERMEKALRKIAISDTGCRDNTSKSHCRDIAKSALTETEGK